MGGVSNALRTPLMKRSSAPGSSSISCFLGALDMTDADEPYEKQLGLLMLSIGHCITQWSYVELQLAFIFHALFGPDRATADMMWSRIRSFEAKLQILTDLAQLKLTSESERRDWNLLREATASGYKKRNEVAHATYISYHGKPVLEPFSVIFATASKMLSKDNVDDYAMSFQDLSKALNQYLEATRPAALRPARPEPASDLLDRLRTADDQKREAQRHRGLAWRQYLDRNPDLKLG